MGLVAGTKSVVPATRISIQNTSTHYGTGPRSKSLRQVPATSPLVCAYLKIIIEGVLISEFKKLLRRRRRQRRLKNEFIFTCESRDTLKSFTLFITAQAIAKLNLRHRNKFEIEFKKISRRSLRSLDNAE